MPERATVEKARALRRRLTPPEARLWFVLKGGKRANLRFRRQHPIGPFVLDFYCPAAKLAVEVDGLAHDHPERQAADARRTAWLKTQGIEVLRVTAEDVRVQLDWVVDLIEATAGRRLA